MRAPDLRTLEDQVSRAPVPVRRQRPNLLRRHWLTGALIFLAVGVMFYTGILFYRAESKLAQLRDEKQLLLEQAKALQAKNLDIQDEITHLNDPKYVEQMAKQLLGMAYPGETVVRPAAGTGAGR